MKVLHSISPYEFKGLSTQELRERILVEKVFAENEILFSYTHDERFVLGGICPTTSELSLPVYKEICQDYFLQTREMGIINIGGPGSIVADGGVFELDFEEGLYLGCETKEVVFKSNDPAKPAKFYAVSCLAFKKYPNTKICGDLISLNPCGSQEACSYRIVKKYVYKDGPVKSNQLVMGINSVQPGNVWNTIPTHIHERRTETFMYYKIPEDQMYVELFGDPKESRHIVIHNEQAITSAAWQFHMGVGTCHYDFIFAMAGENKTFEDVDIVPLNSIQ